MIFGISVKMSPTLMHLKMSHPSITLSLITPITSLGLIWGTMRIISNFIFYHSVRMAIITAPLASALRIVR
jgi:hypothetical protein